MTSRGPTVPTRSLRGLLPTASALRGAAPLPALVVATAGAVLLAVAPALAVVRAGDGAHLGPAFVAWPLVALLALAPAVAAWLLAGYARPAAAVGLLGSFGLLAVGRAAVDLQILADPWSAQRPELFVPVSLAELTAGPAVAVLLLGHVLTMLAGALAVGSLLRARQGGAALPPDSRPAGRSGPLVAALFGGTLAAAGLMSRPFRSSDPYLIPSAAVDAAGPTMVGMLLIAGGALLAACLAASAADPDTAWGGLAGAAAGVAVVALPPLAAAAAGDDIGISAGPLVALGGAALLAGTAWLVATGRGEAPADGEEAVRLPAALRLRRVAGGLAVTAGVAGLLGAVTDQVTVSGQLTAGSLLTAPVVYPARLLVPAGVLLVVLGALMLAPRAGAVVRPALVAGWAAMALAATATLDLTLTATQLDGLDAGFAGWPTGLALLLAPAAGALAGVAGGVEREEADLTDPAARRADRVVLVTGGLAAVLALPAFGLPLVTSADYLPAGLWSRFGVASWGLLAAAAVVVAAGLLAPRSRPARSVALLLGAAAVVAVHLTAVPLVGARGEAPGSVGPGTWFAIACGLSLLAAVVRSNAVWQRERRDEPGSRQTKYAPGRSKTGGRGRSGATRPDARRNRDRSHPRGHRQTRT
ncbi:MAG TPA: hypothetical protein VFM37_15470 [Pseudonocardiaceae bacterium]|nr:hypothetical protein [Pseudonocardiaceae bacterium]